MISGWIGNMVLVSSLVLVVGAYVFVSRREKTYINLLTPTFLLDIPIYYVLPLLFLNWFGVEASSYAYIYVYATKAVESWVFAYAYTRSRTRAIRLPFTYGFANFGVLALFSASAALLAYLPILIQFRQDLLNPRRIYEQTRIGFGVYFYISSTLAILAVILILFSEKSFLTKAFVVITCGIVLALHGSKGQVLTLVMLLVIFEIYARGRRFRLVPALIAAGAIAIVGLGLFAATMVLGTPTEALETISEYSDYVRNAMMLIDSNFPRQYGRLTWESNVLGIVPRALVPTKPEDFGAFRLDAEFYPKAMELAQGAPAFGVGVQYADFGFLAIVYVAMFAGLTGWLARVFLKRLQLTHHPADFLVFAFIAGINIFPIGTGWLFPETLAVAMLLRFASCVGAKKVYREQIRNTGPVMTAGKPLASPDGFAGA
jgi:hypothetical protein